MDNQTIGHASSKDLLHWSQQQAIGVMTHEPQAMNCWAPEVVYDENKKQYVIFWATTIPGRFPKTDGTGDGQYNHRIYSTTTKDFKTFTPARLFFDGGFNVIDATMLRAEGKYYLIVKDETLKPVKKNLRMAVGSSPEGPFGERPRRSRRVGWKARRPFASATTTSCTSTVTPRAATGRSARGISRIGRTSLRRLVFPKGARHGTVLQVPKSVVDKLSEER